MFQNKQHIGSSFDDFLKQEGLFEECEAAARERAKAVPKSEGQPVTVESEQN